MHVCLGEGAVFAAFNPAHGFSWGEPADIKRVRTPPRHETEVGGLLKGTQPLLFHIPPTKKNTLNLWEYFHTVARGRERRKGAAFASVFGCRRSPVLQPVRRRARWHSPRDPAKLAVHRKVRLHFQTVQEGRVLPKIARETLAEKQKEEEKNPRQSDDRDKEGWGNR